MADPTEPLLTPVFNVPVKPQPNAPVTPRAPQAYQEQSGKHKGVAGVARDILGTLGDFLLTRLRMPAMYAPAQRDRKLAAAQTNTDTDPIGAIQQVSSLDPVFGAKLRDQYIDNKRLEASQASTIEARDSRLALAQEAQNLRTRSYAASMLESMASWDDAKRKQFYPQVRQQVLSAGKRQGLDLSDDLPAEFDATTLDAFIDGAVPVGTQRAHRLTKERIDNQDNQADVRADERYRHNTRTESQKDVALSIAKERAAKSGSSSGRGGGGSGRRPTESQIVQDLLDSGKPLTVGQKARVRKYTQGTGNTAEGWSVRKN